MSTIDTSTIVATIAGRSARPQNATGRGRAELAQKTMQQRYTPGGGVGTVWQTMDEVFSNIPPDADEKFVIAYLQKYKSPCLRACLRVAFDDTCVVGIKSLPKFKATDLPVGFTGAALTTEYRLLAYFLDKEVKRLGEAKSLSMLVRTLETLGEGEAKFLLTVLSKKITETYPAVTKRAVMKCWPELISPVQFPPG